MSPRSAPTGSVAILPQSRGGTTVWGLAIFLVAGTVSAQDRSTSPADTTSSACVEVDIGGQRTGTLECLNQRLHDTRIKARSAAGEADPARTLNARSPDFRVGLTNQAAYRQRMGAAYGVSIQPQRPSAVYHPNLPVSPPSPR